MHVCECGILIITFLWCLIALEKAGQIAPEEALHIGDSMGKDYLPTKCGNACIAVGGTLVHCASWPSGCIFHMLKTRLQKNLSKFISWENTSNNREKCNVNPKNLSSKVVW